MNNGKIITLISLIVVGVFLLALPSAYAAKKKKSIKTQDLVYPYVQSLDSKGKKLCGYVNGKWFAGKSISSNGQFAKYSTLKKYYKSNEKKSKKYAKLAKKNNRKCRKFDAPSDQANSLSVVPEVGDAFGASGSSDYSGTPPTVLSLIGSDIKDVFWREIDGTNVIDALIAGNPSQAHCTEFWGGDAVGESGGQSGCFMTQSVMFALEPVERSGTAVCYMKNISTKNMVSSGAVALVSGEFPNGNPEELFNTPETGSSDRYVRINIIGDPSHGSASAGGSTVDQVINIKVASEDTNTTNSNQYQFELWFCNPQTEAVEGVETLTISDAGLLTSTSVEDSQQWGKHDSTVTGYVAQNQSTGEYEFDFTKDRTADVAVDGQGFVFKSYITISPTNRMRVKIYEDGQWGTRQGYEVADVSGADLEELSYLQGAVKDKHLDGNTVLHSFEQAVSYQTSMYGADPDLSWASSELDQVDLSTDAFYQTAPAVTPDFTGYACDSTAPTPDVVIQLDMEHKKMEAVVEDCESFIEGDVNFCTSSTLAQAEQAWFTACSGGGGS